MVTTGVNERADGEESKGAAYDPDRARGSFCGNGRAAVVDDGFWRMFACRVPEDGRGKGSSSSSE
jgi:hypothetical protein